MNFTALALLAHPDDAEILCVGTMIRLRKLGWKIHIATASMGDCGTTTLSARDISAHRRQEARAAAAGIGAGYHCLEEHDGRIVYDGPTIEKTIALFRRDGAFAGLHACPQRLHDGSRDHRAAGALRHADLWSAQRLGRPFWRRPIHRADPAFVLLRSGRGD